MINSKNNTSFSSLYRSKHLQLMETEEFDLVVIGGGITGCGIALDAASRGMKVALLEKNDFASGTSSKSTKLIHGGLRYLKQFELGLVRETGTERAIVHKLAPHLVLPEKMLLPIVQGGTFGKWAASFGVMVYDLLANVRGSDRRKMLSKKQTLSKEPLLNASILKGSCFYAEYRTDDARLTIEAIKTASIYGALALNYCEAKDFIYDDGMVKGVIAKDHLTGKIIQISSKQVVSAGGPWVDWVRKKDELIKGKRLHLTKGVHLVFPHKKLPLQHSIYFDVADGRMVFAIPRGKITYVGTTDTNYKGNLDRIVVTKEDVNYLLNAVNQGFPSIQLHENDIISNWAGLRPLIHEDGKSPSELSRRDEIFQSKSGLISIAGGKLTGYRKMAQRIVDLVNKKLGGQWGNCKTKSIPLTTEFFKNSEEVASYRKQIEKQLVKWELPNYFAWYLTTTYGKQTDQILQKMETFSGEAEVRLARAELWYGIHYEMINSIEDFFIRRTGKLYFDIQSIAPLRDILINDLKTNLKWDAKRVKIENQGLDSALYDATHFYENDFTEDLTISKLI